TFRIILGKTPEFMAKELVIVPPATPVRIGQSVNRFEVIDKASKRDLTNAATWSISPEGELAFTGIAGVLDARNAVSGKTYHLTAAYQGLTASYQIVVAAE